MKVKYRSFSEFYPFYLSQHQNAACRQLHFIGSSLGLLLWTLAFVFNYWLLLLVGLITGYLFAWIGHFFFEHNKPATFQYPLYSFMGDWLMFWQMLTKKI